MKLINVNSTQLPSDSYISQKLYNTVFLEGLIITIKEQILLSIQLKFALSKKLLLIAIAMYLNDFFAKKFVVNSM